MEYNTENGLDEVKEEFLVMGEHKFPVKRKWLSCSKVLSIVAEDTDAEMVTGVTTDPHIMGLVVEFMEYFTSKGESKTLNIPKPLYTELKTEDPWYTQFMDRVSTNKENIIELLRVANFLDVSELLMLTAAKMASMMRGRTETQIKIDWNIN